MTLCVHFQVPLLLRGEDNIPDMADLAGVAGLPRLVAPLQEAGPPEPDEEGGRNRPLDGPSPGTATWNIFN